jgi:hypothetical protein
MSDIVFAAVALFGTIIVATAGYRFIGREDDRFERIALGASPAAWSDDTTDEVLRR